MWWYESEWTLLNISSNWIKIEIRDEIKERGRGSQDPFVLIAPKTGTSAQPLRMSNIWESERWRLSVIGASHDKLSVSDPWPGRKGEASDISGNWTSRLDCTNTITDIGQRLALQTRTSLDLGAD
jgi:hypothetical protein